jgi:hypothetical protein
MKRLFAQCSYQNITYFPKREEIYNDIAKHLIINSQIGFNKRYREKGGDISALRTWY